MADNTTLNSGSGGDVISTDDLGSVKVQRVKVQFGVDGSATDVSTSNPLPVSDAGGSITVDGTVELGPTALAALETITVASITAAIPAGTNNIGDVDVLSVVPGTSATSLGKAEDAAHASGDTGVMALVVRRDADTALVSADGDYAPLQVNAAGSLKVAITSGAGSGGTSIADGAIFTRDTTSITPAGAVVESSAPTLTNGDVAGLSMTTGGALRVSVASGGVSGIAEDTASAGGEEGIAILAVRRDSASSGVSADGDFAFLSVDSSGNLRTTGSSGVTSYTEDGASAGGESLVLMGAVRRDTAASSSTTDGDYSTLNTDANGRLHTIAALAASQTLATVTTVSTVTNVATIGTSVTPGTGATNLGKAEDAAHTSGDVGVMALAVRQDTLGTLSSATGDYEPIHLDASGRVYANAQVTAQATGGATPGRLISAASTNGTVVKASAGTLYALVVTNINAAVRYLKVYNSTSVTVGTTTPTWTFAIPASTTAAGFNVPIPACGIAFSTGICLGMTTGIADNDTGAVAANEIIANYAYI